MANTFISAHSFVRFGRDSVRIWGLARSPNPKMLDNNVRTISRRQLLSVWIEPVTQIGDGVKSIFCSALEFENYFPNCHRSTIIYTLRSCARNCDCDALKFTKSLWRQTEDNKQSRTHKNDFRQSINSSATLRVTRKLNWQYTHTRTRAGTRKSECMQTRFSYRFGQNNTKLQTDMANRCLFARPPALSLQPCFRNKMPQ